MNSEPQPPPPPAGWYADPQGAPNWRWWDGTQWSDQTVPYEGSGDASAAPTMADDTPARTADEARKAPSAPAQATPAAGPSVHKRGTCLRCGKKLSLLQRIGHDICDECEPAVRQALAEYMQMLAEITAGTRDPEDAAEDLRTAASTTYLPEDKLDDLQAQALGSYLERALGDEVMTEGEERQLDLIAALLTPDDTRLSRAIGPYWSRMVIAKANDGRLDDMTPTSSLLLKPDEIVHLEVGAALLKEVVQREFRGGYSGVSVPVGFGIRVRTGGGRGRSVVTGTELQVEDSGFLSVTSERAVFVGAKRTVEVPYKRLVGMQVYSDGVSFNLANRKNAPLFRVDSGDMVAAVVNAAARETA